MADTDVIIQDDSLAHAKFSPSSLGLYEKCPGFRNRKDSGEKSERAAIGTRIHKALEKDNIEDLDDEEERHLAQTFKDFVDGLITENLPVLPKPDRRELRLNMDLGGGLYTFGTCDRFLVYGKRAHLLDYKTGYLPITDVEYNAQAWAYVIGAFQKYPNIEEIEAWLLLPNRDEIFHHVFKRDDVPLMQLRLNTIIRRAMAFDWTKPNLKELNPSRGLCEYCQFQATCPALAQKVLKVGTELGLKVPASVTAQTATPEELADMLRLAPHMEAWISNVKSETLRRNMEDGIEIPGFKRIERSVPRSVTSVIGTWDVLRDKGISIEDFLMACGTISIPKLENFFADKAPKNGKGKARKQLESDLRKADVLVEGGSIYYMKEKKANP